MSKKFKVVEKVPCVLEYSCVFHRHGDFFEVVKILGWEDDISPIVNVGVIDKYGREIVPCVYDSIYMDGGFARMSKDDKTTSYDLIDENEVDEWFAIGEPNRNVLEIDDELECVVNENSKMGVVDKKGNILVDFIYDDYTYLIDDITGLHGVHTIGSFRNGLALAMKETLENDERKIKWGILEKIYINEGDDT